MSNMWLSLVFVALALILPMRSLMVRRVPFSKWAVMALIWGAIFIATIFLIGLFAE
ncbi:hypothetical protein NT2_13_00620 [Caenibius tardaugens NBRC 16725]|uniref:Uncharacterized protein n=1 Tax=Caenibius tardaugens NBRC 16725 TaxID=1219035 RepID=U2YPW1_9SPHN|nr:hypothetical protein [Caenibius tardaugens]GAD50975.1 hypothetical protein NT2_13_00620 [Caenibius tardaugens NBRC 16725]